MSPCWASLTCSSPPARLDQHSVVVQAWAATQRHLAQPQAVQVVQLMANESQQQVNQQQDDAHNRHHHVKHRTCRLQIASDRLWEKLKGLLMTILFAFRKGFDSCEILKHIDIY